MKTKLLLLLFTIIGTFNLNLYSQIGFSCENAISIASLPYNTADNTANYGDTTDVIQPSSCITSTGNYMSGNDVFYSYTPTSNSVINIKMNPTGTWSGIFVNEGCSNVGVHCIAAAANSSIQLREIAALPVTAGQNYIIVISTYATPQTVGYSLIIESVVCPAPVGLTTTGNTSSTANLSWENPANLQSWEVEVQPSGSPMPVTNGVVTNTPNFTATGLATATVYQYWVRAVCGDGTFTGWAGPKTFSAAICAPQAQCMYTFIMSDSFGDGWSGNTMTISQNGIPVATIGSTVTNGSGPISIAVPLCHDIPFQLFWNSGGSFPNEIKVTIVNPFNQIIANKPYGVGTPGSVVYTGTANCIAPIDLPCTAPGNIVISSVAGNGATIRWSDSSGMQNQWEVIVLDSGAPAPTASASGTFVYEPNYSVTGLNQGTAYSVYVRAVCSTVLSSEWSEPVTFSTQVVLPALVTNTTQFTPEQLVNNVLVNNPCINITNVTSSTGTDFGSVNGLGYFTNTNPLFPISSGLLLTSGNALSIPGPNTSILSEGSEAWTGDLQLEAIITTATAETMLSKNATKLEFDFTSLNEYMSFNFLFSSDEYVYYQCTYSDAFAFLLTDLTTGETSNLAVVPNTTDPISVVTIRDGVFNTDCNSINAEYFDSYFTGNTNYSSATNLNGQTAKMTASSPIIPNHPYHIKLVVADRGDTLYDSAVFIEAGSFTSGPPECTDKIQLVSFIDIDNNGVRDNGEPDFNYGSFSYQQNNTGDIHSISTPFGSFTIYDSNTANTYDCNYQINPEYSSYYSLGATNYDDISIVAGSGTQILYFPVTLTQAFNDVTVSIVPVGLPVAGSIYKNKIVYKNLGVGSTSGTLTFTKDPLTTITSVSQTGIVNTPGGFTYNFTNLLPYEVRSVYVWASVPAIPTVNIADVLTSTAEISAPANDVNLTNNSFSNSQIVVASYDPNIKTETHGEKIQLDTFASDEYLYYTIHFQNTGTSNAINVRVEDFLDPQFDEQSIRMVSASHNYVMERINNKIVWRFDYIQLPGAVQNEEFSNGYITFQIKLKPGYNVGDIVPNTASIYFDSNPAIATNTWNTEFVSLLKNASFETQNVLLFPNPASDAFQIRLRNTNDNIDSVVLYNLLGEKVRNYKHVSTHQTKIELMTLAKGIYFVEITTEAKLKLIKKLVVR